MVVPQKLVSDSAEVQIKFERLLQILLNGKWCSAEACNEIEFYWNYMKDAKHAMV